MLDFSWSHILVLLIVALVVVGPKDLPRLMRIVGQWMGKARNMANEFRRAFDDMARQSELDELRKEIETLRNERPLADLQRDLHSSVLPDDMKSKPSPSAAPQAVVAEPIEVETAPAPESAFEGVPDPAAHEALAEPVSADGYKPPSP